MLAVPARSCDILAVTARSCDMLAVTARSCGILFAGYSKELTQVGAYLLLKTLAEA
jgi:hypothetical protein